MRKRASELENVFAGHRGCELVGYAAARSDSRNKPNVPALISSVMMIGRNVLGHQGSDHQGGQRDRQNQSKITYSMAPNENRERLDLRPSRLDIDALLSTLPVGTRRAITDALEAGSLLSVVRSS